MTKMGYKRKNKGGGAGDEADGEEGEGEEQQEAEAEEEMKMGDSIEGSWGKSRGREGRNMIEKKANRMSMDASGGAAADDGSGGLGHPSNVPWDFAVGDRVEGRSVEEGYEGLRAMAGILEIDQVNRRANIQYEDYEDETGAKLVEWVEYWTIRPCPPKTVQFGLKTAWLRKMPMSAALEVWHDDAWNDCDLIGVFPEGSDDTRRRPARTSSARARRGSVSMARSGR